MDDSRSFQVKNRTFRYDLTSILESIPLSVLAPSPRLIAYLARRLGTQSTNMALTTVETPESPSSPLGIIRPSKTLEPPPPVITTPCDPWPRPYYEKGGLRRVAPYHFTYNTYCKERWRDRELLDIFVTEFRDRPAEYYVRLFRPKFLFLLQLRARTRRT